MSDSQQIIVDFSSQHSKGRLWNVLRNLEGKWRFDYCRYRLRRSDPQNRYYWGVIVKLFATFLRGQGESYTDHDAHEVLKFKFLKFSIVNESTGELIGESSKSTATLKTSEFNDYIEKCVAWLADQFGIICPDPNDYQAAGKAE